MTNFAEIPTGELEQILDACHDGSGILTAAQYDAALTELVGRMGEVTLPVEASPAPSDPVMPRMED